MNALIKSGLVLYLVLSLCCSIAYNTAEDPWGAALHRNGLLVFGFDKTGCFILSPFCNYPDVFLFGIEDRDGEIWTYSDGLLYLGDYDID